VSGSEDKTVRLWDLTTGHMEHVLDDHLHGVTAVDFSPNGTAVVSCSMNDSLRIRDLTTGEVNTLPLYESFQLRDGTKVCHTIEGDFQLLAPEVGISVYRDGDWILTDPPAGACWIPPEFHDVILPARSGSKACLISRSGLVVVVDLTTVDP